MLINYSNSKDKLPAMERVNIQAHDFFLRFEDLRIRFNNIHQNLTF